MGQGRKVSLRANLVYTTKIADIDFSREDFSVGLTGDIAGPARQERGYHAGSLEDNQMGDIEIPPERRIRTVESEDGRSRLIIFCRYAGVYQFVVETDWEDEGYAWTQVSGPSGYYDSIEAAQRDGMQELFKTNKTFSDGRFGSWAAFRDRLALRPVYLRSLPLQRRTPATPGQGPKVPPGANLLCTTRDNRRRFQQ